MSRARSVADLGNQNVLTVSATDGNINVGTGVTIENTGEAQFSGIVTAQSIDTRNLLGDVSIGGVLTYEDVTSVDSIGIVTARSDVIVGGGLSVTGISTFVGLSTFNNGLIVVSGVSTLGNTVIGGGTTELVVTGDARVTGILTVGTASFTINGAVEYPTIRPTLDLNFAATKTLDRRITFTRDGVGTYTDELGVIRYASSNVPRFDHDPVTGESLGLLIEESRTNSLPYSSDIIGQANWATAGASAVAATSIAAPDGSTDTVGIRDDGSSGQHTLFDDISVSNIDSTYTASCWVKAGTQNYVELFANGAGGANTITIGYKYDLVNKTISYTGTSGFDTGASATITEYPNGWFRITMTGDVADTATGSGTYRFHIRPRTDSSGNYQGDNTDGIYVWGPQLEEGSFPTSYIPTAGSTVTRAQDFATITGTNFTDFYNDTEGSLYSDFSLTGLDLAYNSTTVMLTNNTTTNYLAIFGHNPVIPYAITGGSQQFSASLGGSSTTGVNYRAAMAYKLNDFAASLDGGTVSTDTSATIPPADRMLIGRRVTLNKTMNGYIRAIKYYNKRLPNAQLQGLTQQ